MLYHSACIATYVLTNLNNGNLNITCCNTGQPLSHTFIAQCVPADLFEKYLRFQLEKYLKLADNIVRCSTPDCTFACELQAESPNCVIECKVCDKPMVREEATEEMKEWLDQSKAK